MEDTISAIATALGVGAVGIIRVSGPESLRLVNRIFGQKNPFPLPVPVICSMVISMTGRVSMWMRSWQSICRAPIPTREKTWWKSSAMADGKR